MNDKHIILPPEALYWQCLSISDKIQPTPIISVYCGHKTKAIPSPPMRSHAPHLTMLIKATTPHISSQHPTPFLPHRKIAVTLPPPPPPRKRQFAQKHDSIACFYQNFSSERILIAYYARSPTLVPMSPQ